jgi:hypothetical protein
MIVVFPAPLGPRRPKRLPSSMFKERLSTALRWLKFLLIPSMVTEFMSVPLFTIVIRFLDKIYSGKARYL